MPDIKEKTVPFTNTAPRLYKVAGKEFLPGETHEIPEAMAEKLRKAPAVKSGHLQEGKVVMPAPSVHAKPASLPDDMGKALAFIRVEDELSILEKWTAAEMAGPKRPEILTMITERAKTLAGK